MQLTSLTLQGFKSFGDRTVLAFAPGVTAVVGPNGSGKSNLIEALRWATGGGRASSYRADEKTDLIFHGASGKRSVSYAEVGLSLHDGARSHHVVRNLFRDGSSKLKLNGRTARFVDVEEVLGGSGLGRGSLAVIGQGEVGGVLMAGPEKLLEYVAEAAGVAKLSGRRDLSLARLDTAHAHLLRLADREEVLALEVSALAEEAEQAACYVALNAEALRLRYTYAAVRVGSLQAEVAQLTAQQDDLTATLTAGRRALKDLQGAWGEARSRAARLETHYRDLATEAEARRGDLRVAEERLQGLRARATAATRERDAVTEEMTRLATLSAPVAPDLNLADVKTAARHAEEAHEVLARDLATAEADEQNALRRLEALRLEQRREEQASASYGAREAQLLAQRADLQARAAAVRLPVDDVGALHKDLEIASRLYDLAKRRQAEAIAAVTAQQGVHARAAAEAAALARSTERASAALKARRGFAQGPKHALTANLPGVFGAVADLVRVPEPYRVALASALGRRVEYVVVDTADTAQTVLSYVKQRGGWVTVLPLDLVAGKPGTLPPGVKNAPGVVGLATDLVEVGEAFRGVFYQLLGTTTFVETLQVGVALAKTQRARPRLVSLAGDVVESYGALSGGQSRVADSVLGLAAEVEEAEASAEKAQRGAAEQEVRLRAFQDAAKTAQTETASATTVLKSLQARLAAVEEAVNLARSLRGQVGEQLQGVAAQLEALEPPPARLDRAGLVAVEAEAVQLAERVRALRAAATQRATTFQEARQTLLLGEQRWQQYAEAQRRFEAAEQQRARLAERLGDLLTLQGDVERDLQVAHRAFTTAQAAQPSDLETKKAAWQTTKAEADRLEAALSPLSESQAGHAEDLERVKVSLARREAALELAQEDLAGFPPGLERLDRSARACRERLTEVETELTALGPVNHRATQDVQDSRARLAELQGQLAEARQAVAELREALATLDAETSSRLAVATGALRRNFKHYVGELFGAEAEADVETLYEEQRPVGIRIALQPPGKRTTALNLLSVGERTMGALAFLFSLMQGDPAQRLPLAVLDEVDAPLDEANIRRFCAFLEQLAKQGTQFVLITHQKATFEIADVLWGVTSDRGVSRLFSIRREAPVT